MRIFIPFKPKPTGGTSSFVIKFKAAAEKLGHEVSTTDPGDYDILLAVVQAPFCDLIKAKFTKKKIVQRLDGVYYWSVAGWKFPLYNLKAFLVRHLFANYTIYQSQYSKYCSDLFLGKKIKGQSSVIYNGVDTHVFNPQGPTKKLRDRSDQHVIFTASDFRRSDQFVPIIEATKHYIKKFHSDTKLVLAGNFRGSALIAYHKYKNEPFIQFLGPVPNHYLPKYERSADVFVISHLNPPCPNNVIEAMACGLPVCGIVDGSMPELVTQKTHGILLPAPGSGFWTPRSYNPVSFAQNINYCIKQKEKIKKNNLLLSQSRFSLDKMVNSYLSVFTHVLSD